VEAFGKNVNNVTVSYMLPASWHLRSCLNHRFRQRLG